jgi:hypothetical protein
MVRLGHVPKRKWFLSKEKKTNVDHYQDHLLFFCVRSDKGDDEL